MLEYYVYAYLRLDGTPYYIGKGKGKRAFSKQHSVSVPHRNNIVFLETHLTEIGSIALERRLIQWWGRKDIGTGILRNRTDGGEGHSGYVHTSEFRRNLSERNKGNTYNLGKRRTAEVKHKQSAAQKGKTLSEEHKNNMRKPKSSKTCPHCGQAGRGGIMHRWHFNNCTRQLAC